MFCGRSLHTLQPLVNGGWQISRACREPGPGNFTQQHKGHKEDIRVICVSHGQPPLPGLGKCFTLIVSRSSLLLRSDG